MISTSGLRVNRRPAGAKRNWPISRQNGRADRSAMTPHGATVVTKGSRPRRARDVKTRSSSGNGFSLEGGKDRSCANFEGQRDEPGKNSPQEIPTWEGGLPFFGNMLQMVSMNGTGETGNGIAEMCTQARDRYGAIVRVQIMGRDMLIVSDPDIVQEFAVQKRQIYSTRFTPEGQDYIMNLDLPASQRTKANIRGIAYSRGDIHAVHRSLAMSSLNSPSVRERMDEVVYSRAVELRKRWLAADPAILSGGFNAALEAQRFSVDVIGDIAFSYDFGQLATPFSDCEIRADFNQQANNVLAAMSKNSHDVLKLWKYFDTKVVKFGKANLEKLQEFHYALIERRRREFDEGVEYPDFLGSLLAARDENGNPLPTRDICWSVHDMFLAGNDTTATTIAAALGMLASHPGIQKKLRAELEGVMRGRVPRAADLEHLPYLEAFVRETLRLYPAVHVFQRDVHSDDVLSGFSVMEGSAILASPYCMHRDPKLWTDPLKFDPERFLPGGEWDGVGGHVPRFAWLPFGAGARACVGSMLGLTETRVTVASLVQAFEIGRKEGPVEETGFKADGSLRHTFTKTMAYPHGVMITAKPLSKH